MGRHDVSGSHTRGRGAWNCVYFSAEISEGSDVLVEANKYFTRRRNLLRCFRPQHFERTDKRVVSWVVDCKKKVGLDRGSAGRSTFGCVG